MKKIKLVFSLAAAAVVLTSLALTLQSAKRPKNDTLRLLYWNIQNGMWDGQEDNYDRFVGWVKAQNPDVCVWCEAKSIYKTGTGDKAAPEANYLPDHWGELAARYGHKYWYKGGQRDNYPQVITSRYPIENVARIIGEKPDSVVSHGAGWAYIEKNGRRINIVTLHTWPQAYAFNVAQEDRDRSRRENGGDRYRRMEIEDICRHTILTEPDAANQLWMMMGDFNSRSVKDNWVYKFPEDDPRLWVSRYVLENTPYVDVIAERNPNNFYTSTGGKSRIDFVYCTRPLYDRITDARIIDDAYTRPVRDAKKISNFYHPSDHLPIIVDFDLTE